MCWNPCAGGGAEQGNTPDPGHRQHRSTAGSQAGNSEQSWLYTERELGLLYGRRLPQPAPVPSRRFPQPAPLPSRRSLPPPSPPCPRAAAVPCTCAPRAAPSLRSARVSAGGGGRGAEGGGRGLSRLAAPGAMLRWGLRVVSCGFSAPGSAACAGPWRRQRSVGTAGPCPALLWGRVRPGGVVPVRLAGLPSRPARCPGSAGPACLLQGMVARPREEQGCSPFLPQTFVPSAVVSPAGSYNG